MKVLYDDQMFTAQEYGGITRYFDKIISRIGANNSVDVHLPILYSNNAYLKEANYIQDKIKPLYDSYSQFGFGKDFPGKLRLYNAFQSRGLIAKTAAQKNRSLSIENIKKGDFDVFHPTYYDPYFLEYIGDKPFVLTVHDMIQEIFPEYNFSDPTIANKRKCIEKASKIIAISENTKNDIISIYGVDPNKIEVIYHGLEEHFDSAPLPTWIKRPYFLYVGGRWKYKNFYFLINALAPLFEEYGSLELVCVGGGAFTPAEKQFLEQSNVAEYVRQVSVSDSVLNTLYAKSEAFIYPSLYEGFGIPILEAFKAGANLLLAENPVFKEVAGKNATYFDPKNISDLRSKLREALIRNEGNSIQQDVINTAGYTWDKCAEQTLNVYKEVLGH